MKLSSDDKLRVEGAILAVAAFCSGMSWGLREVAKIRRTVLTALYPALTNAQEDECEDSAQAWGVRMVAERKRGNLL